MKIFFNGIWNYVLRHWIWFTIGIISWLIIQPKIEEIRTILLILFFEGIAIIMSGLALYSYTKINFIKVLLDKDNQLMPDRILASVFLGVHVLIGLLVLGIYIAQFSAGGVPSLSSFPQIIKDTTLVK